MQGRENGRKQKNKKMQRMENAMKGKQKEHYNAKNGICRDSKMPGNNDCSRHGTLSKMAQNNDYE